MQNGSIFLKWSKTGAEIRSIPTMAVDKMGDKLDRCADN